MSLVEKPLSNTFLTLNEITLIDPEDIQPDSLEYYFKEALKEHDFFYIHSDDANVYNRGQKEEAILTRIVKEHPSLRHLWTEYVASKASKGAA